MNTDLGLDSTAHTNHKRIKGRQLRARDIKLQLATECKQCLCAAETTSLAGKGKHLIKYEQESVHIKYEAKRGGAGHA